MEDVVKGRKNHQHQDDRQTDPEAEFLRPFRQRPSPYQLNGVEQKVTPIEQRNWKEIQQSDRYRQDGREMNQRRESGGSNLP